MPNEYTVQISGFEREAERLKAMGRVIKNPRPILLGIFGMMRLDTQRTFRAERDPLTGQGWPKSKGGSGRTLRDTGRLLNALMSAPPRISGNSVKLGIDTLVYARTHQSGATIRPRRAKMLAIPLTKEARRFKGPREYASRKLAKTALIRSKKGNLLIVEKGSGGKITPVFLLVKKVVVPQRRYLGAGPEHAKAYAEFTKAAILRAATAVS